MTPTAPSSARVSPTKPYSAAGSVSGSVSGGFSPARGVLRALRGRRLRPLAVGRKEGREQKGEGEGKRGGERKKRKVEGKHVGVHAKSVGTGKSKLANFFENIMEA